MVCEYLNPNCKYMPIPLMNIINGGMHANNNLDIQEFMIMPVKADNFKEALRKGGEIIQVLKNILINKNYSTNVGDEGGVAPNLSTTEEAIELILGAVEKAGYRVGEDVVFALDSAASEFYKNNKYNLKGVNCELSSQELIEFYKNVSKKYPIFSIEDAMAENDENGWVELSKVLGKNNQLVGDDIFVTNLTLFQKYVKKKIANAILIKPNQIGTITETLEVINYAQKNNYNYILSHRSGETEDTTIAHLAVATGSKQIKTGSLCRTDRTAKYNELIRIEEKLGNNVYYPSIREIKNF